MFFFDRKFLTFVYADKMLMAVGLRENCTNLMGGFATVCDTASGSSGNVPTGDDVPLFSWALIPAMRLPGLIAGTVAGGLPKVR